MKNFKELQQIIESHNDSKNCATLFFKNRLIYLIKWSKYMSVTVLTYSLEDWILSQSLGEQVFCQKVDKWLKDNPEDEDNYCEAIYQAMNGVIYDGGFEDGNY